MNEYDPTTPDETPSAGPPRPVSSPVGSAPMANEARRPGNRRSLWNRKRGRIMAAALMVSVTGLSVGLAPTSPASAAPSSAPGGHFGSGGGGSNARSGPAAGGSSGTVGTVSNSSFTLTTSAGQKVTVNEASSTKYQKGTSSSSASAIKKGQRVLVLGTVSSTTITASQITVQTGGGSATSSAGKVVPFQSGATTTSKQVGQIPANYTQGSGTIVSGTTANKATVAALAAYSGGVVDRVVKLSNGEYEVHNIGVSWPHHIFVNQNFKVVGAN
jgi:hypothetical protein